MFQDASNLTNISLSKQTARKVQEGSLSHKINENIEPILVGRSGLFVSIAQVSFSETFFGDCGEDVAFNCSCINHVDTKTRKKIKNIEYH